jgi:hypothetical protein
MAASLTLNTFGRWEENFSGIKAYSAVDMNNPKTVTAHWKFDVALLVGTTGAILSVIFFVKLFPQAIKRFRKGKYE